MEGLSNYWNFARLKSDGSCHISAVPSVSAYLQSTFPDRLEAVENDQKIRCELFAAWQSGETIAGLSLRCRISHAILQECNAMIQQYGAGHRLDRTELLTICLTDEPREIAIDELLKIANDKSRFRPLGYQILASYDPSLGAISTWTKRLTLQDANVKHYLKEHGLILISDWALLNDTKPKQVCRMLINVFNSSKELAAESALIHEAYRSVYLIGASQGGRCIDPTEAQLQQMGDYLSTKTQKVTRNDDILKKLRYIADRIRQYRLNANSIRQYSLNQFSIDPKDLDNLPIEVEEEIETPDGEIETFWDAYQRQFKICLDGAIDQVIQYRLAAYRHPSGKRRAKPEAATQMLKGLYLYYCKGKSQGEIAPLIGLQRPDQVSRLLELPDLRSDIRLHMLPCLKNYVEAVVEASLSPQRLIEIDVALEAELNRLVQDDKIAGATNRRFGVAASRLAQYICRYLDSLPPEPAR
jgi:hypothetical protein